MGEDYHTFHRKQFKVVLSDCGSIDPEDTDAYIAVGGYEALRKVLATMKPQDVIETIKSSGLRGRGGAGFPTAMKWDIAMKQTSPRKYLICNADEGDPGAAPGRDAC